MKCVFTLFTFLLASFFTKAQTESFAQKMQLKADIAARHSSQMVSYNGKLYFFGGYNQGQVSSQVNDFWEYTPTTKIFRKLNFPNVSNPNTMNVCHVIGNKMYVGLGSLNLDISASWAEYDFITGIWTAKASYPGVSQGNQANLGATSASFVINDTIFVCNAATSNSFYSYNILTNTWTQRANFPGTPRGSCTNFSINGKGYIGGGFAAGSCAPYSICGVNDFYEYNPITNIWATKTALPFNTRYGLSAVVNGKGYAGTGQVYDQFISGTTTTVWKEYNPLNDTWVDKAQLPNVWGAVSATVGTDIFVFGGKTTLSNGTGGTNNSMLRYNTLTNVWSVDTLTAGGNRVYGSTFYHNNKIYMAGGSDGDVYNDTWEYDIPTDIWTRKADMPSRFSYRASAKIGNKLYVVGGYNVNVSSTQSYTNELLEYDIATNTWATKTAFPDGGLRLMSAFTINNELYAGLGWSGTTTQLQTYKGLYKYNFTNNTWQALASCPRVGSGETQGTFVIGDTAYVVFEDGNMWAYNRVANSWSQKASVIDFYFSSYRHEAAFSMSGNGYTLGMNNINQNLSDLKRYNPSTNTWDYVRRSLNIKRRDTYNTVVVNDSTFYIGLGKFYQSPPGKYGTINDWHKFTFNADIATKVGDIPASPLNLWNNETFTVYDSLGGILLGAIGTSTPSGGGSSNVSGRSADTLLPFREKMAPITTGGPMHNIMFLNKNILISATGGFVAGTKVRLFFTNREISKFVTAFNTKYGTSYTESNISIFKFSDNNNPANNDLDPVNNNTGIPTNYAAPTIVPYGTGKYFEITVPNGELLGGELYAILSTTNWALPLNLLSFNAVLQNTQVLTQWQTTNEVNVSHMNVQRSIDGTSFSFIGKVDATGFGTYNFTDATLPTNIKTLYYRLEIVDKNGDKQFSKVVAVQLAKNNLAVTVYPNPVKDILFASITSAKQELVTIQLTDLQGKVLQNQLLKLNVGNNNFNVATAALAKGTYILVVCGEVKQHKIFVKE